MNSKTLCSALFVILCSIPMSYGIMCWRCLNEKECKDPTYVECNAAYAEETVDYLDTYFSNVTTVASNKFDCVWLNVTILIKSNLHGGCIYSDMQSCEYDLRKNLSTGSHVLIYKQCHQCNNTDGCNFKSDAHRAFVNAAALVLPVLFILKFVV